LLHSSAPTYADDTTTSTSFTTVEETIKNMETDSMSVLKYMASNGLVANPKKTSMLILNCKPADMPQSVKIRHDMVNREMSATLLGIKFQDNLQWAKQIHGKGGLIATLNSRLYIIRRMISHVSKKSVLKLVDGMFMYKIRYGLQLYG
jgi:hypothetical protein